MVKVERDELELKFESGLLPKLLYAFEEDPEDLEGVWKEPKRLEEDGTTAGGLEAAPGSAPEKEVEAELRDEYEGVGEAERLEGW